MRYCDAYPRSPRVCIPISNNPIKSTKTATYARDLSGSFFFCPSKPRATPLFLVSSHGAFPDFAAFPFVPLRTIAVNVTVFIFVLLKFSPQILAAMDACNRVLLRASPSQPNTHVRWLSRQPLPSDIFPSFKIVFVGDQKIGARARARVRARVRERYRERQTPIQNVIPRRGRHSTLFSFVFLSVHMTCRRLRPLSYPNAHLIIMCCLCAPRFAWRQKKRVEKKIESEKRVENQ